MGTGYTRQSAATIAPGETITAAGLELEFDAIEAAYHGSTGHSHDGTTGEGPLVSLTTSVSGILQVANGGNGGISVYNATTAPTVNEDSADGYAVGSVWIDTTNDVYYVAVDVTVGNAIWRRFQSYDAELAALAGLTSAADTVPYFTGSGTAALTALPAYGRAIISSASEAAFKSGVNLEIGTDVQAWSSNLDEYSAVNPTAAGLALLDDADAAAQLTTLGVSAFIQTLLNDADEATARDTLGVVIGQDVQAYQAAQSQATWNAGVGTTESVISPEKLAGAITTLAPAVAAATTTSLGTVELATDSEALAGTGAFAVTTGNLGFLNWMPVGTVVDYAGSSAPSKWLLCYGQAINRTTYSALFSALGTTYGVGDGSSTFNIPDLRGRVIAGKDDMGGSSGNRLTGQSGGLNGDTLGASGGVETHTLTEAQLATHDHTQAGSFASGTVSADHAHVQGGTFGSGGRSAAHTHFVVRSGSGTSGGVGAGSYVSSADSNSGTSTDSDYGLDQTASVANAGLTNTESADHSHNTTISGNTSGITANHTHTVTISGNTATAGSSSAHNNVQPTIILNKMIYTGVA
jgi:microcystin-dependent protein